MQYINGTYINVIDTWETFIEGKLFSCLSLIPKTLTKRSSIVFSSDLSDRMAFIAFQMLNLLRNF